MQVCASVVWHYLLLLMNSFNKTEAAIFSKQALIPEDFPFYSDRFTFKFVII